MLSILVVDDSELNRQLVVSTLKNAGVENEILETEDGEGALGVRRDDPLGEERWRPRNAAVVLVPRDRVVKE